MKRRENVLSQIKGKMTVKKIVQFIAFFTGIALAAIYTIGIGVMYFKSKYFGGAKLKFNPFAAFEVALKTQTGIIVVVVFSLIILIVLWFLKENNKVFDRVEFIDKRKVRFSKSGTYGTAVEIDPEELTTEDFLGKKFLEIKPIENTRGNILGLSIDKRVISISETSPLNKNVLMYGAPGTGKTRVQYYINIVQAALRGESLVMADPSAEIYETLSPFLRTLDYTINIFNLKNPTRTDGWNCMKELFNPITGEADEKRANEFVDVMISNIGATAGKTDAFWDDNSRNFFKALCLFEVDRHVKDKVAIYRAVFDEYVDQDKHKAETAKARQLLTNKLIKANNKRKILIKALLLSNYSEENAENLVKQEEENATPYDISHLYYDLTSLDILGVQSLFKDLPNSNPAKQAFNIFDKAPDGVKPNIVTGLAIKLQILQTKEIRVALSNEEINIPSISSKRTAVFCIIPDTGNDTKPISALFFAFLFKDLAEVADREGVKTRLAVTFFLDEIFHIGTIPNFPSKIGTVRKRNLGVVLAVQAVGQIYELFGEILGKTVIGCCDTQLYLGCNDDDTVSLISDRTGDATIIVNTIKTNRQVGVVDTLSKEYADSFGEGKRMVFTPNEIYCLPNADMLVFLRGTNVFRVKKMDYSLHPASKGEHLKRISVEDYPLTYSKYLSFRDAFDEEFTCADYLAAEVKSTEILDMLDYLIDEECEKETTKEVCCSPYKILETEPWQESDIAEEHQAVKNIMQPKAHNDQNTPSFIKTYQSEVVEGIQQKIGDTDSKSLIDALK